MRASGTFVQKTELFDAKIENIETKWSVFQMARDVMAPLASVVLFRQERARILELRFQLFSFRDDRRILLGWMTYMHFMFPIIQ